ncbi:hypothetical protein H0W91_01980 [Patescibacteria group bacterium]|nr:hypothetical protein [Patescibacteria group bacterium]
MDPEKDVQNIPGIDSPPEKIPDTPKERPIKSLRTYQGDVEEAIVNTKSSSASILIAEQKRRERNLQTFDNPPKDSKTRNEIVMIGAGLLLLLGVVTMGTVYYLKANEKVTIEQKTKALVGFSNEKKLNVASSTREQIMAEIVSARDKSNLPLNSVLYFNTINSSGSAINIDELLITLAPRIPESLARSFEGRYMIGIYSFDQAEPFIILKTADYPTSFSGMLKWEKDIPSDIGEIFSISPTASSTFSDLSLKNKDLRILKNSTGQTILSYSFIDKTTLIITKNEGILTAILQKYLIGQQGI